MQKWLTLVRRLESAIHAVSAAPPPQQCKAAPPGNLTREHRTGPRSSHPAGFHPPNSLNRIGSAFPLPQPVLRCKRRSQLSQYPTPVRPHVLHPLPCRYGEGDMYAIAGGTDPPAGDALGTAEQTTGQHQGRCLMDTEPISFHELHPANDRTVGRVHLVDFHTFLVAPGQEVRLDLAIADCTVERK